jgi:hypothetical protein
MENLNMPRTNKSVKEFAEFLDKNVILVAGGNDGYIDPYAEEVHVAIVVNVTGYGPHTGAIFVDQNRFHASADTALEGAYELLEEWERDHYPEADDEHRTETFEGQTWTLPALKFADAIDGTAAERFIDIEAEEGDDGEGDDEDEESDDDLFSDEEMRSGFVISDSRRGGYDVVHEGKSVGKYDDMDDALEAIEAEMKRSNFYPNIYYVNDHGNVDLLDSEGNVIESRV